MKPNCSEQVALGTTGPTAFVLGKGILIAPHAVSQAKASHCTATPAF